MTEGATASIVIGINYDGVHVFMTENGGRLHTRWLDLH